MTKSQNSKLYDLEERTFQFAKAVRIFVKTLSNTIANIDDGKQLIRASGSVGANYIEANESLGKKDFLTWNSPLLAAGMDQNTKPFIIIGETKLSRRDTPQLAAGRVH